MGNIRKFISGVISSYIYIIVTSLIALWLTPYTLSFMDKTHYGYYILIADILAWINLLQFGVSGVFNSKAAMCIGKADYVQLQKYTNTAQLMQSMSAVMILIIGVFTSFFIDAVFDTAGILKIDVILTFIIAAVTSAISVIKQPLSAILVANKQVHIDNFLNLFLYLIQVLLVVLFLNLGFSIISLSISHLIATILITLITYYRVKKLPFKLDLGIKKYDKTIFGEFLSTGLWFTIGSIGQIFIYKIDRFFIGSSISLDEVTSFYITTKLYDFSNVFFANFVNISRPYFSQLYVQHNMEKLRKLYDILLNGSILLLVLICSVIFLCDEWFIKIWIKNEVDVYLGDKVSLLFAVSIILQSAILPNRVLLASTLYKVRFHGLTRVAEGCLKFLLSIFLVDVYGIQGLLISSIISCVLCSTIFMNYLSNKVLMRSFKHQIFNYLSYLSMIILLLMYIITDKRIALVVLVLVYVIIFVVLRKFAFSLNNKGIFNN